MVQVSSFLYCALYPAYFLSSSWLSWPFPNSPKNTDPCSLAIVIDCYLVFHTSLASSFSHVLLPSSELWDHSCVLFILESYTVPIAWKIVNIHRFMLKLHYFIYLYTCTHIFLTTVEKVPNKKQLKREKKILITIWADTVHSGDQVWQSVTLCLSTTDTPRAVSLKWF